MKERGGIKYFSSPGLEELPGITHAFLGRAGGVSPPPYDTLNFDDRRGDSPSNVSRNRGLLSRHFAIPAEKLVTLNQVHGDMAVIVDSSNATDSAGEEGDWKYVNVSRIFLNIEESIDSGTQWTVFEPSGDIIVTALKNTPIGILTADCLPVLLYDATGGVAAAVHAGWKGTLLDVCGKALRVMSEAFGSRPQDVIAALGPGIGACCYTIGPEVISEFEKRYGRGDSWGPKEGRYYLDIGRVNRARLMEAGVPEGNIDTIGLCTSCRSDLFFSYRKEAGKTGRQLSFIMISGEGKK